MTDINDADVRALLAPWSGPFGGLPPFERATPGSIEGAYLAAVALRREEIAVIAANSAPATFENTIAALEDSGRELQRVDSLLRVFSSTRNTGEMGAVARRLAPLMPALEDEIAHDDRLIARLDELLVSPASAQLSQEQRRLISVVRSRLARRGAGLSSPAKARLARINGRIAELQARFSQNLIAEDERAEFTDNEAELEGLGEPWRVAAAEAARARGQPGHWAIPNTRQSVWLVLTWAARRELREKVWRMWTSRGAHSGEHDNRPVIAEILQLRHDKARLLGFKDFAHFVMADRMVGTPEAAISLLQTVWEVVFGPTQENLAELQALVDAEGGRFRLAPWDRLYYAEKLRKTRFGLDATELKNYLELGAVIEGMFWAADRLHGLSFTTLKDVVVCHPDIQVFEVSRSGAPVGVLYLDLFPRPGKSRGSWQNEYRLAESFRGQVLPIASVNTSFERPHDGGPVLLAWDSAKILFHELGHALHVLLCKAHYPSLGCAGVAWDAIELPSLLNERWLYDHGTLNHCARHHQTGEPLPPALIEAIEQGARFDRAMTLTLDFLASAIVDMRIHLGARDAGFDPLEFEQQVLAELGMPVAVDPGLPLAVSEHVFGGGQYAAGLYSYLWGDVMAADVAEAFATAPGGFFDARTGERWRSTILETGIRRPIAQAFRNFQGRDPEPAALFRRFGLDTAH